jgi:hypothetical protein
MALHPCMKKCMKNPAWKNPRNHQIGKEKTTSSCTLERTKFAEVAMMLPGFEQNMAMIGKTKGGSSVTEYPTMPF